MKTQTEIKISKTDAKRLYTQIKSIQLGQLNVNTEQLKAMVDTVSMLKNLVKTEKKDEVQAYEHGQGYFITSKGEEIYFRSEKEYQKLNREYYALLDKYNEAY